MVLPYHKDFIFNEVKGHFYHFMVTLCESSLDLSRIIMSRIEALYWEKRGKNLPLVFVDL